MPITVTGTDPSNGAGSVAVDRPIDMTITHSVGTEVIDDATLYVDIQYGSDPVQNAIVAGVIQAAFDGFDASIGGVGTDQLVLRMRPISDMPEGTTVTITFPQDIDDIAQTGPFTLTGFFFGTDDETAPTVDIQKPANGSEVPAAGLEVFVEITDISGVDATSVDIEIVELAEFAVIGGTIQSGWAGTHTAITDGRRVDIVRDTPLDEGTSYTLEVTAEDLVFANVAVETSEFLTSLPESVPFLPRKSTHVAESQGRLLTQFQKDSHEDFLGIMVDQFDGRKA